MPRTTLSGLILGLLLLCPSGLFASVADELREKAKAFRKEASTLAEQGKKEEAEKLEKKALMVLEYAGRLDSKAKGDFGLTIIRSRIAANSYSDPWEKAKAFRREASELAEQGKREEAAKLMESAERLEMLAEELGVEILKERLGDRLGGLLAKERKMREAKASEQELAAIREQIAGAERELHATNERKAGLHELPPEIRAQAQQLEVATRRIHYIRAAAENLKMAEVHDLAQKLMEQAAAMEREVQETKKQLAIAMQKGQERKGEQGANVVRELQEEVERLRSEVKELRQKVEKR